MVYKFIFMQKCEVEAMNIVQAFKAMDRLKVIGARYKAETLKNNKKMLHDSIRFTSPILKVLVEPFLNTQKSILKLKEISGKTWEDLADYFQVSKRALHWWANGKKLSIKNKKKLQMALMEFGTQTVLEREEV